MKFLGKKSGPNVDHDHNNDHDRPASQLSNGFKQIFNQVEGQAKDWVGGAFESKFSQQSQNPMVR